MKMAIHYSCLQLKKVIFTKSVSSAFASNLLVSDLVKAVEILIKNGATLNAANKQTGNTALVVAAKNGIPN